MDESRITEMLEKVYLEAQNTSLTVKKLEGRFDKLDAMQSDITDIKARLENQDIKIQVIDSRTLKAK
jgi:hypothetical protein